MDINEYWRGVSAREKSTKERFQQAAYNHLYEVRKDLAMRIVTTDADPFYVEDPNDPRWLRFMEFVCEHWDD